MKNILVYYVSLGLLLPSLVISLVGCGTTSFVNTVHLPKSEFEFIKKCGFICVVSERMSFDIDVPVSADYIYMPYTLRDASFNIQLGYVAATSIVTGFLSGLEEAIIEDKESYKLSELLSDWDIALVFRNTFFQLLKDQSLFEIVQLNGPIPRKEIKNNSTMFLKKGIDTILDIHVTDYGIQSKSEGFVVFMNATLEIINLKTNEVVASTTVIFDYDNAVMLHENNKRIYMNSEDFALDSIQADSIFSFPVAIESYYGFVKDQGKLLKRELKLASLETSRELLAFLKLYNRESLFRNEYRFRPKYF